MVLLHNRAQLSGQALVFRKHGEKAVEQGKGFHWPPLRHLRDPGCGKLPPDCVDLVLRLRFLRLHGEVLLAPCADGRRIQRDRHRFQ
jgi:hypothetical protein